MANKVSREAMDEYISRNPKGFTPRHRGDALTRITQKEMNKKSGTSGHGKSRKRSFKRGGK